MSKTYVCNEVFFSLQGEGVRAGTANIFIRFTGCNLECNMKEGPKSPGGFDCDTEFTSGRRVTLNELHDWMDEAVMIACNEDDPDKVIGNAPVILTGGEPGLQVDGELVDFLHDKGHFVAIETNGTIALPASIDWITLSPKVAEHAIKQTLCDEIKYVRGYGQEIPKTKVVARHHLISPAFDGGQVHPKTLQWCIKLCLENPQWRLSVQQHKGWLLR